MPNSNWTLVTVAFNSSAEFRGRWSGLQLDGARWIVVDNCSSDDSAEVAESLGAHVVRLADNRGFAVANNVGLSLADTEYVAFVNPDVRVESRDLRRLAGLIDEMNAIVSPQLLNSDGSRQPNGRGLPFLVDKFANRGVRLPGARLADYVPEISDDEPTTVDWFMGAVVCGRRDYFASTNGWDEGYFLYYEDHVMGLEANARGLNVIVDPRTNWVHGWARETRSFAIRPWLFEFASAARFYRRYPYLLLPTRRLARRLLDRRRREGRART